MSIMARLMIVGFLGFSLSGCIAAAAGAGAAGGYYFEKHYKVEKNSKTVKVPTYTIKKKNTTTH